MALASTAILFVSRGKGRRGEKIGMGGEVFWVREKREKGNCGGI